MKNLKLFKLKSIIKNRQNKDVCFSVSKINKYLAQKI